MKMKNANKICLQYGYTVCPDCPLYETCTRTYDNTTEFEIAMENAAVEYLKRTTKEYAEGGEADA